MSDEEQEIVGVKIKYHGQCPSYKGHAVSGYMASVFLGFLVGVFLWSWVLSTAPNREKEAIELGYATYDPITGRWQWIKRH